MADRERWLYGKGILHAGTSEAVIRFLSVSQLSKADPEEEGCLRKHYYEYVLGRKPPQKRSAARGTDSHAQIERFLRTGVKDLDALVLSGLHMIPRGGDDLLIEHDLCVRPGEAAPTSEAEAGVALARAPLRVDGIPLVGKIDLVHGRGENQGTEDIEQAYDPEGTVEVCDWKTTSRVAYVKPAAKLPRLIQMAGYGEWVKVVEPGVQHLRLSHGYFIEAGGGGRSRKVSLRVLPEEIEPTWARATAVARQIRHAAREASADAVEANTRACKSFGGCYHRDVCSAGMHRALAGFVGIEAADRMLRRGAAAQEGAASPAPGGASDPTATTHSHGDSMNLLDRMKARNGGQPAAPAVTQPPTPATPPAAGVAALLARKQTPAPAAPDPAIAEAERQAEIDRLQAEEAEQKGRRVVADLVVAIEAYGLGRPQLGPAIAGLWCRAHGKTIAEGASQAGTGDLGESVVCETIESLQALAGELKAAADAGSIPQPGATPATAAPAAPAAPATPAAVNDNPLLAPEAPVEPVASAVAPVTPPAEPEKKTTNKRATRVKPEAQTTDPRDADGTAAPDAGVTLCLLVDCTVEGLPAQSLWPWIDEITTEGAKVLGVGDLRTASKDGPGGFGAWKGLLAAAVREQPLAAGIYTLDTRGSEIAEIVAEAMRGKVRAAGGFYARGIR